MFRQSENLSMKTSEGRKKPSVKTAVKNGVHASIHALYALVNAEFAGKSEKFNFIIIISPSFCFKPI